MKFLQLLILRILVFIHDFSIHLLFQIVNMFANDGLRVFELVLFVPMIVGGPVSMMLGISYVLWLLGPWPLFGISAMFLFYPMQVKK